MVRYVVFFGLFAAVLWGVVSFFSLTTLIFWSGLSLMGFTLYLWKRHFLFLMLFMIPAGILGWMFFPHPLFVLALSLWGIFFLEWAFNKKRPFVFLIAGGILLGFFTYPYLPSAWHSILSILLPIFFFVLCLYILARSFS